MDVDYANKQLNLIESSAVDLGNLFYCKEKDFYKIEECYHKLIKEIGDYIDYLHRVNVPFTKSYISKWVEEDRNVSLFDDVQYYLG